MIIAIALFGMNGPCSAAATDINVCITQVDQKQLLFPLIEAELGHESALTPYYGCQLFMFRHKKCFDVICHSDYKPLNFSEEEITKLKVFLRLLMHL